VDQLAQAELVKSFMLRIAPELTRWTLRNAENPDPASNAKMALEWAVYLAGQYASCYDMFHAPENAPQTPDPSKTLLETVHLQREAQGGAAAVR
jgi:hypothetical protein